MTSFPRYIMVFFLVCSAVACEANDSTRTKKKKWYTPHYIPLQFAGNVGFLTTGLAYTSNKENYELNLLYGYVPPSVGDQEIHMITAKNIFPFGRYSLKSNQLLVPYLGLGLMVEVGGHAFFTLPAHYPEGYYDFPKNLHVTAFAGAKLRHLFQRDSFLRGLEFYAETGTIDVYIWYRTISNEIKFNQMFSVALGVNFLLPR